MSRPKDRIYTEKEFHDAESIDRIYMHLLEPDRWDLTQTEDDRLAILRKVWTIICEKNTPKARIKLISDQISVTERTVHRYISDAQYLFGDMLKVDMELELNLAYARLMKLHDKAYKEGDYETARRCQDNAMIVLEKIEARAPKQAKVYAGIIWTSDPKALRPRNEGEYTDFELDEPSSILEPQAIGVPSSDTEL